ncbi:MAG TPA: hypothetical protein PLE15_04870, partial [Smithellaceae bacterium]|nr:hypothetical protein [Smithellaceae bacterium]
GEVESGEDQKVVNAIAQGDAIKSITIEGDATELMESIRKVLDQWNKTLDVKFPKLQKAL